MIFPEKYKIIIAGRVVDTQNTASDHKAKDGDIREHARN